ncbi:hypothetical protein ACQ4PT_068326 [Festuca glaucescens]
MEGLVPGNRVNQFRDQLKEGFVYTIVRFDLYDPKKNYRSVDHPLRIYFTMRIVLTEVVPPPENFPMFAYNALPFSMLSDRIDRNIVLSDILPPSGKAKSHKRQVYIIAGSEHAIVTLWGEQADLFDADGFMEASSEEHVIVLFVGMIVSQYSGLLAFKSTSVTRWHVNVPILEIAAVRERVSATKYLLESLKFSQKMGIVIGKEALILVSSVRGQSNAVPQDLLAVVGKEFSVVVTPRRESLDALYSHLQMQIAEPIIRANVTLRQGKTDPTTGCLQLIWKIDDGKNPKSKKGLNFSEDD